MGEGCCDGKFWLTFGLADLQTNIYYFSYREWGKGIDFCGYWGKGAND